MYSNNQAQSRENTGSTVTNGQELEELIVKKPDSDASPKLPIFMCHAKEGKFDQAMKNIQKKYQNNFQGVAQSFDENGKSILHLACESTDSQQATSIVEQILALDLVGMNVTSLTTFINKKDNTGRTSLHIAIMSHNVKLVEVLLRGGADMNLTMPDGKSDEALTEIYGTLPQVMVKLFNECLNIEPDEKDPDNEWAQWVTHDFTPIIGLEIYKPNSFEVHETNNLSKVLRHATGPSRILSHPLAQIFMHLKTEKYQTLIYASAIIHIAWNLLGFAFILYNLHFPFTNDTGVGAIDCVPFRPRQICSKIDINVGFFSFVLITLIVMSVKEAVEAYTCPDYKFYWKQIENTGQVVLIALVFVVFLNALLSQSDSFNESANVFIVFLNHFMIAVYFFGILIALFLVQGQISKFPTMGIYREMFVMAFWHLLQFLAAFSPLLVAFMVTFYVIMPEDSMFGPSYGFGLNKIFAMMIGEFEYDGAFKLETFSDSKIHFWSASIVFFIFVLLIVILLQNLLIGLTVSDVKDLRDKAKESYVASRLEDIFLIENFMTIESDLTKFIKLCFKLDLNVSQNKKSRLYDLPPSLREDVEQWIEKKKCRDREKEKSLSLSNCT